MNCITYTLHLVPEGDLKLNLGKIYLDQHGSQVRYILKKWFSFGGDIEDNFSGIVAYWFTSSKTLSHKFKKE